VAPALVDRHWAVFLAGGAWNLLITAFAVTGLKLVVRFEWAIVMFQYAVLLAVAAVALYALAHGHTAVHFSWHWFSLEGLGGLKGLMAGILIACFMYSGWDAAIYVNEETRDRANNPGKAAIASVAMLAVIYSLATLSFQRYCRRTNCRPMRAMPLPP
jgi:amino acid transporter